MQQFFIRTKNCIKKNALDNRGMTMVEVMMGFVILITLMGALSGVMAFASNLLENSVDLHKAEETLQSVIYKDNPSAEAAKRASAFTIKNEVDGKVINITADMYELSSENVLVDEEKESLDVKVYFFKP